LWIRLHAAPWFQGMIVDGRYWQKLFHVQSFSFHKYSFCFCFVSLHVSNRSLRRELLSCCSVNE
jgi:hypothetical protein